MPSVTSARVRNRFESVEVGGDMSSNCTRRHWDYRLARQQARGTRYQVPGRRYIREHSSVYVPEYRVYTGYKSITCLLRTGITDKYAFMLSYLAPSAFVVVVMEKMILKVGRNAQKSMEIAANKVGIWQHLGPGPTRPRKSWFAAFLDCIPEILLLLCCCYCCCAHLFVWR